MMSRCLLYWSHLIKTDFQTALCDLPSRFTSSKTCSDNINYLFIHCKSSNFISIFSIIKFKVWEFIPFSFTAELPLYNHNLYRRLEFLFSVSSPQADFHISDIFLQSAYPKIRSHSPGIDHSHKMYAFSSIFAQRYFLLHISDTLHQSLLQLALCCGSQEN